MSNSPPVVFYQYETSPFAQKIARVLILKGIKHQRVDVDYMPPRPALSDVLGIRYRRIPVLAIGRDVYVDTSLITTELEKRFPEAQGYSTIFPERNGSTSRDTGLIKAFVSSYPDRTLFRLLVPLISWNTLPDAFVKDRAELLGAPIEPEKIIAMQPAAISSLISHLNLVEEQLSDGRQWLFDTVSPSLADIAMDFVLVWAHRTPSFKTYHDSEAFPHVASWMKRMSDLLADKVKEGAGAFTKISGEDAGRIISSASYEGYLHFDEKQAKLLGLTQGVMVSIAPDDTGKDSPTEGVLVGFSREEAIIETNGSAGAIRAHFPRIGFVIRPASKL